MKSPGTSPNCIKVDTSSARSVGGDVEREIKTLPLPQIPEISLTSFPTSSLEWLNIISVAGGFMTLFLGTMKD